MKTINYFAYGHDHSIQFVFDNYMENDNLYIGMVWWSEDGPVPYTDVTKNLSIPCKANCSFVDTNNNYRLTNWLEKNGFAKETGNFEVSGYCMYPEYEFDLEKMKEYEYQV